MCQYQCERTKRENHVGKKLEKGLFEVALSCERAKTHGWGSRRWKPTAYTCNRRGNTETHTKWNAYPEMPLHTPTRAFICSDAHRQAGTKAHTCAQQVCLTPVTQGRREEQREKKERQTQSKVRKRGEFRIGLRA